MTKNVMFHYISIWPKESNGAFCDAKPMLQLILLSWLNKCSGTIDDAICIT